MRAFVFFVLLGLAMSISHRGKLAQTSAGEGLSSQSAFENGLDKIRESDELARGIYADPVNYQIGIDGNTNKFIGASTTSESTTSTFGASSSSTTSESSTSGPG